MTARKESWAARAERRTAWAESAEAEARRLVANQNTDPAFLTQPGRISGRAAQIARCDRAFALLAKAKSHRAKAGSLRAMAGRNAGDAEAAREAIRETRAYQPGESVVSVHYGPAVVVRVNAKTVRIRTASGFEITQDKAFVRPA